MYANVDFLLLRFSNVMNLQNMFKILYHPSATFLKKLPDIPSWSCSWSAGYENSGREVGGVGGLWMTAYILVSLGSDIPYGHRIPSTLVQPIEVPLHHHWNLQFDSNLQFWANSPENQRLEPENHPFGKGKGKSSSKPPCWGSMLVFGGV